MRHFYLIIIIVALAAGYVRAEDVDGTPDAGDRGRSPLHDAAEIAGDTPAQAAIDTSAEIAGDTPAQAAVDTSAEIAGDTSEQAAVDTSAQTSPQDTVDTPGRTARPRVTAYDPARVDSAFAFSPSLVDRAGRYRSDGADPAEMLRYRALTSVYVPLTLSGGMNRLLYYGAPVPCEHSPFMRTDRYHHLSPAGLTGPELSIFWESGPFAQNTLNLSLGRPLSPNLMVSFFSNSRYLRAQRFNHEGNDIANFYKSLHPDTSTVMNRGYNPLVDEHMLGAAFLWSGADSSVTDVSFAVNNLKNEYALDVPVLETDRLEWARLRRSAFRADAALRDKRVGAVSIDVSAAFVNEYAISRYDADSLLANWSGESNNFMADADFTLPAGLGLNASGALRSVEYWNGEKRFFYHYGSELFYTHRLPPAAGFNTSLHARAGALFEPYADTSYIKDTAYTGDTTDTGWPLKRRIDRGTYLWPKGSVSLEFLSGDSAARLNIYARHAPRVFYAGYDSLRYTALQLPEWFESNRVLGAEGEARLGYLGLLLGYQYTTANSMRALRTAWPEGFPPYHQPRHTVVVAPWAARYRGFSMLSRAVITDTRPYLKASVNLSHIIRPESMDYTFEPEVGFEYWSERAPFLFAGHHDEWNRPIYDLNVKVTAHIKTFRLFYKIDNLLNVRQAYVPGYFSPGLTFRWGMNWFLQ